MYINMSSFLTGGVKGFIAACPSKTAISLDGLTTILSILGRKYSKESSAVKSGSGQTAPPKELPAISLVGLKSNEDLPDKSRPPSLSTKFEIVS